MFRMNKDSCPTLAALDGVDSSRGLRASLNRPESVLVSELQTKRAAGPFIYAWSTTLPDFSGIGGLVTGTSKTRMNVHLSPWPGTSRNGW